MQYLLDTHALLWFIEGNPKLSLSAQNIILKKENEIYVSIASLWEIAIKLSKEKPDADRLTFSKPFEALYQYIEINSFQYLSISLEHLYKVKNLPHHHGDPFDRLLIAHAITENMTMISVDKAFRAYPVATTW